MRLQVNTLGDAEDRRRYRDALVAYYTPFRERLCDDCKRRLDINPLRLLDCKKDSDLVAGAPVIWDLLDAGSKAYFNAVLASLDAAGVTANINHRVVRGLDYYADTVFEFWHDSLHGAQNSLGGGGRYDGLAELLGLTPTPGTGYALGVERILMVARRLGVAPGPGTDCDVLVCSVETPQAQLAASAARTLRAAGARVVLDISERRLDRKLRSGDRLGARVAVIVGEDEVRDSSAVVRDLDAHAQRRVPSSGLESAVFHVLGVGARRESDRRNLAPEMPSPCEPEGPKKRSTIVAKTRSRNYASDSTNCPARRRSPPRGRSTCARTNAPVLLRSFRTPAPRPASDVLARSAGEVEAIERKGS